MDVVVTRSEVEGRWNLSDLLDRPLGYIDRIAETEYVIHSFDRAHERMTDMGRGPFRSLDAALLQIETHTRCACRRRPGEDQA